MLPSVGRPTQVPPVTSGENARQVYSSFLIRNPYLSKQQCTNLSFDDFDSAISTIKQTFEIPASDTITLNHNGQQIQNTQDLVTSKTDWGHPIEIGIETPNTVFLNRTFSGYLMTDIASSETNSTTAVVTAPDENDEDKWNNLIADMKKQLTGLNENLNKLTQKNSNSSSAQTLITPDTMAGSIKQYQNAMATLGAEFNQLMDSVRPAKNQENVPDSLKQMTAPLYFESRTGTINEFIYLYQTWAIKCGKKLHRISQEQLPVEKKLTSQLTSTSTSTTLALLKQAKELGSSDAEEALNQLSGDDSREISGSDNSGAVSDDDEPDAALLAECREEVLAEIIAEESSEVSEVPEDKKQEGIQKYEDGMSKLAAAKKTSSSSADTSCVQDAIAILEAASDLSNAQASFQLATMYLNGEGVEKNEKQALFYFATAFLQGHPEAKNRFTQTFNDDIIAPLKAQLKKENAAAAAHQLGLIYYEGQFDPANMDLVCSKEEFAADLAEDLALMFVEGFSFTFDEKLKKSTQELAAKAVEKHITPMHEKLAELAECGARQNKAMAASYFELGSELGNSASSKKLSEMYLTVNDVMSDQKLGKSYARKAAAQEAQEKKAAEQEAQEKKAEKKAEKTYQDAMLSIQKSPGENRNAAVGLIKQASAAGHANASHQLAQESLSITSVNDRNIAVAGYLELAARQGHPSAAAELLGFSLNLLRGVTQESDAAKVSTACHCFTLATAHLKAEDLYATGKSYWEGVTANPSIAAQYFRVSAARAGLPAILEKLKTDFPTGKAQFLLGQAYWLSGEMIRPCSETEFATSAREVMDNAILCFTAAAKQNYERGTASHMLSTLYQGVNKLHLNHRHITSASKKQHVFNARDFVQNPDEQVIFYLQQAYEQGHTNAAFELGKLDEKKSTNFLGIINETSPEFQNALAWYKKVPANSIHYKEAQQIIDQYSPLSYVQTSDLNANIDVDSNNDDDHDNKL